MKSATIRRLKHMRSLEKLTSDLEILEIVEVYKIPLIESSSQRDFPSSTYDKRAGGFSGIKDSEDVGGRNHQVSTSNQRSVCEQCVPSRQEGQRSSPGIKAGKFKYVCSLPSFQDGRSSFFKVFIEGGRFYVQNLFERCIFQCPTQPSVQTFDKIFVERATYTNSFVLGWVQHLEF